MNTYSQYHASLSCARVTGRWVLLSSVQNVVRWLTFNLKPRLSIMDFVLQLDKSRNESLSLRLSALIQKVSMESLRGNVSASTCLYSVHWKWNEDVHDNLVFRLPSNPELAA